MAEHMRTTRSPSGRIEHLFQPRSLEVFLVWVFTKPRFEPREDRREHRSVHEQEAQAVEGNEIPSRLPQEAAAKACAAAGQDEPLPSGDSQGRVM